MQSTHYQNANSRIVQIRLMGPFVPDGVIHLLPPEDIVPFQFVDFDATHAGRRQGSLRFGLHLLVGLRRWRHERQARASRAPNSPDRVSFKVTLTVTTPAGTFGTSIRYVPVGLPAPPDRGLLARIRRAQRTGQRVLQRTRRRRSEPARTITQYRWNFGDGSASATTTIRA